MSASIAAATVAYPRDFAVAVRMLSPCSIDRVYASYPSEPPIRYVEKLVNSSLSLFALEYASSALIASSPALAAFPTAIAPSEAAMPLNAMFSSLKAVPAVDSNPLDNAPIPPVANEVPTIPSTCPRPSGIWRSQKESEYSLPIGKASFTF